MSKTIILINGMAYKCKRAKITINNNLEDASKEWEYSTARHFFSSAMIEITKAEPLSNFEKKNSFITCQNGLLKTIELITDEGSTHGYFAFSLIKMHKSGLISFEAVLSGEISHYVNMQKPAIKRVQP